MIMFECKVCGAEFELKKENRYCSEWRNPIFGSVLLHECFDCPVCGCQNIVGHREPEQGSALATLITVVHDEEEDEE